jgi:hypothetical protein
MAYNKAKIYEQAEKAIKENNLFFVDDIVAWLPCGKTWWYDNFPPESEEMNNLRDLLEINKTKTKSAIRSKLFKSDKAGELLALYRLLCTNEERQMLNQQYIDMTSKGKQTGMTIFVQSKDAKDLLNEL